MKQAKRALLVLVLSALATMLLHGVVSAQTMSTELLGFTVTFDGATYDPVSNQTTFTYTVKGTPNADKDLSHFDISLCLPKHKVVKQGGKYKTSHPGQTEIGTDPTTGLKGIKFDIETSKRGQRTFWFVLEGQWQVQDIEIAGKAGRNVEFAYLAGPSCDPVACELHYSIESDRVDLRVMRPGIYASRLSAITISGNTGARLTFSDFGDPSYLADASAPSIAAEYSIGESLEDAESFGWHSADDFNDVEVVLHASEVKHGVQVVLWVRHTVKTLNHSSDYEALGRISIIPDCP